MKKIRRKLINTLFKNNILYTRLYVFFLYLSKKELNLNLCSGTLYEKGWINIDENGSNKVDLIMNIVNINKFFKKNSIKNIKIIHGLSYLRFHEAIDFLQSCYNLLEIKGGGKIIIEFPEVKKLSNSIININSLYDEKNYYDYIEALRAFYAFDLDQHKKKVKYTTYRFGWSAMHIKYELEKLSYKNIEIKNPEYHDKRLNRDVRIEARK